jgi:hypothetical protein
LLLDEYAERLIARAKSAETAARQPSRGNSPG